ncbi:hypothetical protein MXB_1344 [Myxobolus squamalis]|nr:hypothetical protein MXB_1344 [Myxobolus squamalis]
MRIYTL